MPIINNVSELNERITFYSVKPAKGPEPGEEVTKLFSCWAKVRTQYIKDMKDSHGTYFQDTIEIVIRQIQSDLIDNSMMIEWDGEMYNIIKISSDTTYKEFMTIVIKKIN